MEEERPEEKGQIHNSSWLQRVAEQSWEPELLISGLAVFATSQLPAYVRELFQYYQFNFQVDVGIIDELLPFLAVSVFLTALQVLSFAFIFHFVIRAFWVGLMGLNSVFPNGINYDKLENSELYKNEIKRRLGDKDSFILATDRLASLVFSVAFLLVCYMFGTGVIYFFTFLVNDKDSVPTDLMFTTHPKTDQSGYRSLFLFPDSLTIGKHFLNIKRASVDKDDAERDSLSCPLSFEGDIPFWIRK